LILSESLRTIGTEVFKFPGAFCAAFKELTEKLITVSSFKSKFSLFIHFKVEGVRFLIRAELEESRIRKGVGDFKSGGVSGDGSRFC
jgi:hypothetical protein